MASIALQILAAVKARLEASSVFVNGVEVFPPANLTVDRERIGKITPRQVYQGPLIVVHMGGQKETQRDHYKSPMLNRTMQVLVTITANANDVPNSEAVDPPYVWLVQALQSEPTLGGLAHWISEEGQEDFYTSFDESSEVIAVREMILDVAFHTRTDNPEVRS